MKSLSVIIVDDSDDLRSKIKEFVETFPHVDIIGEANNGADAIELINKKQPDYLILDIQMPIMSGIEVLKKLKDDLEKIDVIILTNHAEEMYRKKCLELGAKYFLDKTNDLHKLQEIFS